LSDIKNLEREKEEIMKRNVENDFIKQNEELVAQIQELEQELEQASRTEAKNLRSQINQLTRQKNAYKNQMEDVDVKVGRIRSKIEGLNDKIFKTSVKTSQLGRDGDRQEYWYFREEPSKVFVKKQGQHWFYYEHESEIELLFNSLNSKGIRERKLLENSRKILDKLKVKKTKQKEEGKEDGKEEEKEEGKEEMKEEESKETDTKMEVE